MEKSHRGEPNFAASLFEYSPPRGLTQEVDATRISLTSCCCDATYRSAHEDSIAHEWLTS